MANGGAVAAAAGAAAIANAIKASGVVVRVSPDDFLTILDRAKGAVVVHAMGGFFSTKYKYLVGYKGFVFFTKSSEPLPLPTNAEMIVAAKIWVPD
jgi:hypothetical protein